jgi:UDP-3-O-[3-hydroxymyristoyl] glucosamine N-acyltransferase
MAAQSGIAGSGILGERCVVGGQVAIVGHLSVANGTKIGGQSGVTRSVKEENTDINGTPAHSLKDNLRSLSIFRKLPALLKRIEEIERKL